MSDLQFHHTSRQPVEEARQGEAYAAPEETIVPGAKQFYMESYGCAMNFSDSEIVASILKDNGYQPTKEYLQADLILINTCAIRDNAEQRVRARLAELGVVKKHKPEAVIGVLGCMAERLKAKFLEEEKLVDIVVGPDAYRDLPNLVLTADSGQKAVNVLLSREETYADISPVRIDSNGVSAFVSITRGCDNMCTFCVVPFTRGRERSRDPLSIMGEVNDLFNRGFREVTLLGQNVDSYLWYGGGPKKEFDKQTEDIQAGATTFSHLLEMVAQVSPKLRVRFSTSNPRDLTEEVVWAMAKYDNICKCIHLPVQSGNTRILEKMNRGHSREQYMQWITRIKEIVPSMALTTDMIVGFCSETEAEFEDSLSLMEWAGFDYAYMYFYSERPGTPAAKKFPDDVTLEDKKRRLAKMIKQQRERSELNNQNDLGQTYEVLVEGFSKRSEEQLAGRNSHNKMVVFPRVEGIKPGDYVMVKVNSVTSATLLGEMVG
ncbi:tRNA (N6-isopentenyl adenosine(37)-C2)-methylthiotransferase MiaB [soil metagenome]